MDILDKLIRMDVVAKEAPINDENDVSHGRKLPTVPPAFPSAAFPGSKDSDSPGYVCVQGEKGFMKVDSKPNIASELKTVYADENIKEKVKDAAGAMVRATITEDYKAPEHHHRMTQEFTDFARVIDEKDYETAKEFLDETVAVVKVLETARKKAGIEF